MLIFRGCKSNPESMAKMSSCFPDLRWVSQLSRSFEAPKVSCECSRAACAACCMVNKTKRSTKVAKVTCLSDFMVVFFGAFFSGHLPVFRMRISYCPSISSDQQTYQFQTNPSGLQDFSTRLFQQFPRKKSPRELGVHFQSRWDFCTASSLSFENTTGVKLSLFESVLS